MGLSQALALCRFLHFGALMLIFGGSAFVWALVPSDLAQTLNLRVGTRRLILAFVVGATAVGWLSFEAGQMGNGWADMLKAEILGDVLFGTAFGQVWQVHLVLVAGLIIALLGRQSSSPGAAALFSGMSLASLGFIGHATIHPDLLGWAHRANHAVHLLAAGAWVGSLVPLLPIMRAFEQRAHRDAAALALRRFSQAGHWIVALVVATGGVDTGLVLSQWPSYPLSPYAGLWLGKVALVAGMIVIALVNRYGLVPRIGTSPAATQAGLRRNTIAELVLGGCVLALSIGLASFDPH